MASLYFAVDNRESPVILFQRNNNNNDIEFKKRVENSITIVQ